MELKEGKTISELSIGDKYSQTRTLTEDEVQKFAVATGDSNPIHLDKTAASKTVFGKPIVHGVLLLGFVSGVIGMEFPGSGTVAREITAKFVKPVYVGESVRVDISVTNKKEKLNMCYLEYSVFTEREEIAVKGKVTIIPRA